MPSPKNSAHPQQPLSFTLSPPTRQVFHPNTFTTTPSLRHFRESVFGWPAIFLALKCFAHTAPGRSALRPARYSAVHMSSSPAAASQTVMGAQPSADVTMMPVSPSSEDSTVFMSEPSSTSSVAVFAAPKTPPAPPQLRTFSFTTLPDELIAMCYANLSAPELVALEHVSRRLRHLIAHDAVCWKRCTEARWAHLSSNSVILAPAARHAGTWKKLYAEKAQKDKHRAPWLTLCNSETLAILDVIKGENTPAPHSNYWPMAADQHQSQAVPSSPPKDNLVPMATSSPVSVITAIPPLAVLSVVLLVDASSSVTDDDFYAMKTFSLALVDNLRVSHPEASVAVVQFNQHPKVEIGLTNVCKTKLSTSIDIMEQLMGSTDIAAPIRRARQILAEEEVRPGDRAIVLLTDGQTHSDELQESEREARKAFEEVGARLFTLGVGRDIDEVGLGRVARGSEGGMHFTLRRLAPSK